MEVIRFLKRWPGSGLAATTLILAVGGCGAGGSDQAAPQGGPSSPSSPPAVTEPIVGCTYDYQPMKGPRAIARRSDLVVRGTIGTPRPGLTAIRADGSPGRVETDIIPIRVSSVLTNGERLGAGSANSSAPSLVEVELDCSFSPPHRAAKLASLEGRPTVAYLVNGPANGAKGFPGHVRYLDGAPRPRFQEASLEGFLIELASGNGVRNVSLGERFRGSELSDFYPDRRKFPPRRLP